MKSLIAFAAALLSCTTLDASDAIVKRTDFSIGATWKPHEIMGKTFHPLLDWEYGGKGKMPLYNECAVNGINYFGKTVHVDRINDRNKKNFFLLPESEIKTNYTLRDLFRVKPINIAERLYSTKKLEYPLFVTVRNARPPFFLSSKYVNDKAEYMKWKAAHPNFVGFRVFDEFDSDMRHFTGAYKKMSPEIKAFLGNIKPPKDQYAWGPLLEELFKRERALHFGETKFWTMHSSSYIGHLMAKYGASGFFYEASGQGVARWQIAGAFARGAARQYNIPFGWYVAHWYTGRTRDGKRTDGENRVLGSSYKYNGKDVGLSRTMVNRQNFYGWLIGANFIQHENWGWLHNGGTPGAPEPSEYARDFNDLYLLSKRADRGVTYAPVAIMTPIFEQYNFLNGNDGVMTFGDLFMQNAFFYTLLPVLAEDQMHLSLRKQGIQGCLFNSPFGDFYDVICPDAGQKPADLGKVLSAYKCAFLVGDYRPSDLDIASLEKYVKDGGTLFLSSNYVKDGLIPEKLAGVKFGDVSSLSGKYIIDEKGIKTALKDSYLWENRVSGKAKPLLKDENGSVAAYRNEYGEGAVVTVACKKMLPAVFHSKPKPVWRKKIVEIISGKQTFELLHYLLARVQDETMPFTVDGDIQHGLNKTSDGWLLWLINNKGVTKFTYEPEIIDPSRTAVVRVGLRSFAGAEVSDIETGKKIASGKEFKISVAPGQIRMICIKK